MFRIESDQCGIARGTVQKMRTWKLANTRSAMPYFSATCCNFWRTSALCHCKASGCLGQRQVEPASKRNALVQGPRYRSPNPQILPVRAMHYMGSLNFLTRVAQNELCSRVDLNGLPSETSHRLDWSQTVTISESTLEVGNTTQIRPALAARLAALHDWKSRAAIRGETLGHFASPPPGEKFSRPDNGLPARRKRRSGPYSSSKGNPEVFSLCVSHLDGLLLDD